MTIDTTAEVWQPRARYNFCPAWCIGHEEGDDGSLSEYGARVWQGRAEGAVAREGDLYVTHTSIAYGDGHGRGDVCIVRRDVVQDSRTMEGALLFVVTGDAPGAEPTELSVEVGRELAGQMIVLADEVAE